MLKGKTIIVIGATGGIGRVLARVFSREGANVVLSARTLEKLTALSSELSQNRTLVVQADASSSKDVLLLLQTTREKFGSVDAIIIAAGTWKQLNKDARLDDAISLAENHFRSLFLPTFVAGFAAQKFMREQGHGLIVSVSSHAAIRPELQGNLTYSPMKAASRQFMHSLYYELEDTGVRATDLMPAIVNTEEAAGILDTKEKREAAVQPEEIAAWIIEHFDDPKIPKEKLFDSSVIL